MVKGMDGSNHTAELRTLLATQRPALMAMVAPRIPRQLRSLITAEDVVQEASLEALRSVADFRPGETDSLRRWVWRITRHRLCDMVKSLRRLKRAARTASQAACEDDVPPLDSVAAAGPCPSTATTCGEAIAALRLALAGLPQANREALHLRHIEGLSVPAVAARLGRTTGAVRMLCNRGVKMLRRALMTDDLNGSCEGLRPTSIGGLTGSCDPDGKRSKRVTATSKTSEGELS
jgi:RNA polymerase sigma-70 factor, ECF subfamily